MAIHNSQVIDHDEDFQSLHTRIRQRFGRQPVLLRRVEAEPERVLVFGDGSPKCWQARTHAMAAGITDHIWTVQELLLFPVPPWRQEVSG